MTYKTITTDVDIYLDEFDTDDLIEELESRGHVVAEHIDDSIKDLGFKVSDLRRNHKPYETELERLLHHITGRVIT